MPIDNDNRAPVKAMIKTQYGPVIERTLCTFILKDLAEIMSSMKMMSNSNLNWQQRMQAREEFLRSTQVKRSLLVRLQALKYMRHDMIDEVIKQYDLKLPFDEIAFYHDVMAEIAKAFENQLWEWIQFHQYEHIHAHLNRLIAH